MFLLRRRHGKAANAHVAFFAHIEKHLVGRSIVPLEPAFRVRIDTPVERAISAPAVRRHEGPGHGIALRIDNPPSQRVPGFEAEFDWLHRFEDSDVFQIGRVALGLYREHHLVLLCIPEFKPTLCVRFGAGVVRTEAIRPLGDRRTLDGPVVHIANPPGHVQALFHHHHACHRPELLNCRPRSHSIHRVADIIGVGQANSDIIQLRRDDVTPPAAVRVRFLRVVPDGNALDLIAAGHKQIDAHPLNRLALLVLNDPPDARAWLQSQRVLARNLGAAYALAPGQPHGHEALFCDLDAKVLGLLLAEYDLASAVFVGLVFTALSHDSDTQLDVAYRLFRFLIDDLKVQHSLSLRCRLGRLTFRLHEWRKPRYAHHRD